MFKFDNTHIFTGYLKQLLSSVNIPTCKIYTKEFADYYRDNGKEDPRIVESIDNIGQGYLANSINYLKNNELFNYHWNYSEAKADLNHSNTSWQKSSTAFYSKNAFIPGLTKTLKSSSNAYDSVTHEYLGDYLRFLRDYHNIDMMSLYNCFSNKIYNNIYFTFNTNPAGETVNQILFDSRDPEYHIYAFPVKLFADYTIAINCDKSIEMFCGLYKTKLESSDKDLDLAIRTYVKSSSNFFSQPIVFDKLNVKYWNFNTDAPVQTDGKRRLLDNETFITRWDIINREQDLKLFIKIPTSCRSSIVVLEGNFQYFNNSKYSLSTRKSLTMDSCFVGANVTLKGKTAAALRSYAPLTQNTNIESFTNCYSIATLQGSHYWGLVGPTATTNNTIACCYNATQPIAGAYSVNAESGLAYNVINSYESFSPSGNITTEKNPQYLRADQVIYVNPDDMKSEEAFKAMPYLNTDKKYITTTEYPALKIFSEISNTDDYVIWAHGTKRKPTYIEDKGWYEIADGAQLAYVIESGGEGKYYKITNDIFLNDPTMIDWTSGESKSAQYKIRNWYTYTADHVSVKPFRGTIDGDGHMIYGLYTNSEEGVEADSAGLLPLVAGKSNVTIKNLGIDYAYIKATNAAGFVGIMGRPEDVFTSRLDNWDYQRNSTIINFGDDIDINKKAFTPINRLQLLALNTGESYPFADRLVEYLSGSAITPIDPVTDNIKRAQRVMRDNQYYFKIEGIWEDKMQKIIYDYLMNAGPFEIKPKARLSQGSANDTTNDDKNVRHKISDRRRGYHDRLGYISKSTLYDVLGYVDRETEKWYASWTNSNNKAAPKSNIQNVDIYDGLFDI